MFVPSLGHLFSCSFDGTMKVWDYQYDPETNKAGKVLQQFSHHDDFRCLAYAEWESKKLVLIGTDQSNILAFPLTRLVDL